MTTGRVLALSGGVGGAKLALGLSHVLPAERLAVLVNTGDDFEHLGLRICPDIDTILYTLSGKANPDTGWGRRDESWHCLDALRDLGAPDWFQLGDRDLATHLLRRQLLDSGERLTGVTAHLALQLGVGPAIVPMSDTPVATLIDTPDGELAFQHYFVRERCAPTVTGFRFAGIEQAQTPPELDALLATPDLSAIVICPSNPFVSIDPILAVPGLRERLRAHPAPVVAISPIIGGQAVKGPTAKMMTELGVPRTSIAVAEHYRDLLDGLIIDRDDSDQADALIASGLPTAVLPTLMVSLEDRIELARATLAFAETLAPRPASDW